MEPSRRPSSAIDDFRRGLPGHPRWSARYPSVASRAAMAGRQAGQAGQAGPAGSPLTTAASASNPSHFPGLPNPGRTRPSICAVCPIPAIHRAADERASALIRGVCAGPASLSPARAVWLVPVECPLPPRPSTHPTTTHPPPSAIRNPPVAHTLPRHHCGAVRLRTTTTTTTTTTTLHYAHAHLDARPEVEGTHPRTHALRPRQGSGRCGRPKGRRRRQTQTGRLCRPGRRDGPLLGPALAILVWSSETGVEAT